MTRLRPAGQEPSRFRAVIALPLAIGLTIWFVMLVYQLMEPFGEAPPPLLTYGLIPLEVAAFAGIAYMIPWVAKKPVPWLVFSYAALVIVMHFVFVIGIISLVATMIFHFRLFTRERERKAGVGKRLRGPRGA